MIGNCWRQQKRSGVCIGNCTLQWFSSFVDQSALLQNALQANAQHLTKKKCHFGLMWVWFPIVSNRCNLDTYIFDNHDDSIRTDNFLISHAKCADKFRQIILNFAKKMTRIGLSEQLSSWTCAVKKTFGALFFQNNGCLELSKPSLPFWQKYVNEW